MNDKQYLKQQGRNDELFYINSLEEKVNLIGGLITNVRWDILIKVFQKFDMLQQYANGTWF
jgi:hypothetical protein